MTLGAAAVLFAAAVVLALALMAVAGALVQHTRVREQEARVVGQAREAVLEAAQMLERIEVLRRATADDPWIVEEHTH